MTGPSLPSESSFGEDEADSKEIDKLRQEKSSILASVMNLSNTAMGAGILGLPFAVSQSGYALSAVFFLFFAAASSLSLNLGMSVARRLSPHASYYSLSKQSLPRITKLVDLAVAVKSFGMLPLITSRHKLTLLK